MSVIRAWVESLPNWLFIFNNADELQYFGVEKFSITQDKWSNLYRFVPQDPTRTILWTTRGERIVGSFVGVQQGINFPSVSLSETTALLSKRGGYI